MRSADDALVEAAATIADGDRPDWALLRSADSPDWRATVAALHAIAGIAHVHETLTAAGDGESPAVSPPLEPGATWSGLRIVERVGGGRFGDVYRAFEPELDRDVALKLLHARVGDRSADEAAVVQEGRLAARVHHPNVVTIYGAGRADGRTGIWMEYVDGRTVEDELVESGPLDGPALERVATELAGALAAVHTAGLVHRDVKTTNVIRDGSGRVVLGDFGTGSSLDASLEARSGLAGTPAYLAPEIFAAKPATPQSDIYALGVLLFRLATGRFPVAGRTLADVRAAHTEGRSQSIADLRLDLPPRLASAIDRALEADPQRRFDSAAEFQEAFRPRHRPWPAIAAASIVTAVAVVGWSLFGPDTVVPIEGASWVLVGEIENRTGEGELDGVADHALVEVMTTSPLINVTPRERVADTLRLMGRSTNTRLDAALARQVALRDGGVRATVGGHISRISDGYAVAVYLAAADSGRRTLEVAEMAASRDEVMQAVRRAALTLREGLGESLSSVTASRLEFERVPTRSLQALHLYSLASQLWDQRGSFELLRETRQAVIALLEAAIAEDPRFADAHLILAVVLNGSGGGRQDEVAEHARQALDLAQSVASSTRGALVGRAQMLLGLASQDRAERARLLGSAERDLRQALTSRPDDLDALSGLISLYQVTGRAADQLDAYKELGALRPNGFGWRAEAARLSFSVGDIAGARALAYEAADYETIADLESEPGIVTWVRTFPVLDAWIAGDVGLALRHLDDLEAGLQEGPAGTPLNERAIRVFRLYVLLGRLDDAEDIIESIPTRPMPWSFAFQARALLAHERQDLDLLREVLLDGTPNDWTGVPSFLLEAGLLGEWHAAIEIARRLRGAPGTPPGAIQSAALALAEGRPDDAIRLLSPFDPRVEPQIPAPAGQVRRSQLLAEAYWATGDRIQGVAVLEEVSKHPRSRTVSGWPNGHEWIKMRAQLSGYYRDLGRVSEAEVVEAELLELLAVADDDHPVKVALLAARETAAVR